ncbi:MAG: hypothetical protein JNK85_13900 [Verrucomicrobiales bacterium]|nr:hypothetical protein [Verrucomicrobiales bacterium]
MGCRCLSAARLFLALLATATSAAQWTPLAEPRLGQVAEARIQGIPSLGNPFDPDNIAVDVVVRSPSGTSRSVPAFWYQPFTRALRGNQETLAASGPGEWRLRWFPEVEGAHFLRLLWSTNGGAQRELLTTNLFVGPATHKAMSFVGISTNRQYFETRDGKALPLVGADVCWHGSRGTYDYDDWFPAMADSGWNWARLWMAPWAFGIEAGSDERQNYRLDRAWQLDHVFELAESRGLRLLLCLDYHGMFETEPDSWGGNNFWLRHPYHVANGGPCANQRAFFTSPSAQRLYQKRLRYLIARYGASPALFAWEFFNEIDNVYRHLDPAEVARWHQDMGAWLKAADPWQHLVSTSLTGGSDRADLWTLSSMDYVSYHSYNESAPARRLSQWTARAREVYGKPVIIAEAGVDWRGWARESDPYLRGFRQLLWGGVMAGSAGTSMSWWWESIHSQNAYPYYRALTNILSHSGWGDGSWRPVSVRENPPAPAQVGDRIPNGAPFDVTLVTDGGWARRPTGVLAVANPQSAGEAPQRLNAFVHGTAHPELRIPFKIDAWFTDAARLVLHLNSVSFGAALSVRADGSEILRRLLPNKDGTFNVNNEYNEDIVVEIPAGHRTLEIRNTGSDWFYLDWVRLEGVLPSNYAGDWRPAPAVTGIQQDTSLLLYLVAPGVEYPAQATAPSLPVVTNLSVVISNVPAGPYAVLWFAPTNGALVDQRLIEVSTNDWLSLALPPFREDLMAHVFPRPRLRAQGFDGSGAFHVRAEGRRLEVFRLETADRPGSWTSADDIVLTTESTDTIRYQDPDAGTHARRFYQLGPAR